MKVLRISHSAVVTEWRERDRRLIDGGVELTLLTAKEWDEGGSLVRFAAYGDSFASGVRTVGKHPNLFLFDPVPIWRALRSDSWDLVDIHEEPCSLATSEVLLLKALTRLRAGFVLYSAQNIDKRYPIPFRWLERHALRTTAGVYVCNAEAGRILVSKGLNSPAPLIPLGVDLQHFAPAERAAPHGVLKIGYVGRLASHKGVSVLIDAVGADERLRLTIVGAGPDDGDLKAQAAGLGERVRFHGHADTDELRRLYRDFDVVAVPSLDTDSWLEQFGRVAVEAMASGVPTVASRSGALPDVVSKAGVLVPPADPDALRAALVELLENPAHWAKLRDAGLAHAGDFAWSRVASMQIELYRIALGAPEVGRPDRGIQVLVVAYGSAELLISCLPPLGARFPVTVVDNSSSAQTRVLAEQIGAVYVDAGANLGFGAGVNRGLQAIGATGDDILLLNPDAAISAAGVLALQRVLWGEARLAAVAPRQIDPRDGSSSRVSWPFPSPGGMWIETVGLGRLRRRPDFAIGSILLIKAEALADVGEFDERFFLYAEEIDWQLRARARGWRSLEVTSVSAEHEGAGTGGDPTAREIYFHASHELLIRKHYGVTGWQVYRLAVVLGSSVRAVVLPGRRRQLAANRVRLYLRGPVRAQRAIRRT